MLGNEDSFHLYSESKNEFSRLKNVCYLDHAATTLYSDKQIEAIYEDLRNNLFGNPHSLNLSSKFSHDTVDQIRFQILNHFGTTADDYDVIFTSGATSALKSVVEWFDWSAVEGEPENINDERGHFVYTRDNHTSVLGLREIANESGAKIHCLEHDQAFKEFKKISSISENTITSQGNSLFVYPAQCNFSGCKYPLQWIEQIHNGILNEFITGSSNTPRCTRWFCLLDAAAFLSTNRLDLSIYKPDFVAVSFHKIFGYPTGLGALIVKNSSAFILKKSYYGGGTVLMSMSSNRFHVKKPTLHERCEDGTINYLSISSLRHGFETMRRIGGSMDHISRNVFSVTQYLHSSLLTLHHCNGQAAVIVYRDTDYSDISSQGNIINFNLLRASGEYIGYTEVLNIANLYNIHLRTGCFCNPGACQRHLGLTDDQVKTNYKKGHNCAESIDIIYGHPTGSVRVSFGYMSDKSDADKLLNMIKECFLSLPVVVKVPDDWHSQSEKLMSKFRGINASIPYSLYLHIKHNNEPKQKEDITNQPQQINRIQHENITLSRIYVYPIKSCAAYNVKCSWPISKTGLKYDREWMVVKNNVALTQKQIPQMCLIVPHIKIKEKLMFLKYKDSTLETPIPMHDENYQTVENSSSLLCQNKVCNDRAVVIDCGDTIAHWLEKVLNSKGIRLMKLINREKFEKNSNSKTHLSLANQAQYLLINAASVQWLVEQMSSEWECSFESVVQRFRSNFVISGECKPLEEFEWKGISIGQTNFKIDGPCQRCQMICVDQSSAEKSKEPLVLLSSALKGKLKFGVYLSLSNSSTDFVLEIGQTVTPIS